MRLLQVGRKRTLKCRVITTIQAAVNAAKDGDVIHVGPGLYKESVTDYRLLVTHPKKHNYQRWNKVVVINLRYSSLTSVKGR